MAIIFSQKTARNGAEFKIQNSGTNWTLYVKEKGSQKWDRIQSSVDANFLYRVMMNQKEFRV